MLNIASEKQGLSSSSVQKRYSLKPAPPKKDPKVKAVNSSAVQAFLKKRELEEKKKELQRKREKEELLAKRVELKSDRKARAMASRTKDNFKGYNGIPVVEQPKKRQSKGMLSDDQQDSGEACDDEDNYEYAISDSESEPEPEPEPTPVPIRHQEYVPEPRKVNNTPKQTPKPSPSVMKFEDLIKLAAKKQFEPVELKPIKKTEERLRTAEEIRELEIERKAKKQDKGRDVRTDKSLGHKDNKSIISSQKKIVNNREIREGKPYRVSDEKPMNSGINKTPKLQTQNEKPGNVARMTHGSGSRPSPSSSGALSAKASLKGPSVSVKQNVPRPHSSGKPSTLSDLSSKKGHPVLPQVKMNPGSRPEAASNSKTSRLPSQGQVNKGSGQSRPSQSNISRGGPPQALVKGAVSRSGGNPHSRPGTNPPMRSAPDVSMRQAGVQQQQQRPGSSQSRPGTAVARPSVNGPSKAIRPTNMDPARGRPQCTVVSETISSKNFAPKPGIAPRPSVPQGSKTIIGPTGHRMLVRPPGPDLPPINLSYKRKYEDEEEYDSEMEDFIDDEGENQDEISKHIKEIFGYDRNKYKDESEYALKFMESSWKEQQKEEARSLRLGIKEDKEEELRLEEEEEMKRKQAMKAKRKKT